MTQIIDNQYLGSVSYYKILYNSSGIELSQYDFHQKSGFANRCYIAGANGLISLSIPLVKGRNQKTMAKDVMIDNQQKWQVRHWRALESSYMRSPWFEFYRDDLKRFYDQQYDYLFNWNEDLLIYIVKQLGWQGQLGRTAEFKENYPADLYIDSRNSITPKNYSASSAAKYTQVFEEKLGFLPNLSIVDLLFVAERPPKAFFSKKSFQKKQPFV